MKTLLKTKVERFFRPLKKRFDPVLDRLMEMSSDVLLFGGLLRELALGFPAYGDSDIDMVLVGVLPESLERWALEAHANRNRFDGYRTLLTDLVIPVRDWWPETPQIPMDIWSLTPMATGALSVQ